MIFAVSKVQLEAFQMQTGTECQSRTVAASFLLADSGDFHLVGSAEIVSGSQIYLVAENQVHACYQVMDELIVKVVQDDQRRRQT